MIGPVIIRWTVRPPEEPAPLVPPPMILHQKARDTGYMPSVEVAGKRLSISSSDITIRKEMCMNKVAFAVGFMGLSVFAGSVSADPVRDWRDLEKVHQHVVEAIHEMERARAANHYDMDGHGAKAEELLRQAEHELHDSVEAAKAAR
jgi:hypothetical protein